MPGSIGGLPVLATGVRAAGPATNAPASWKTTSSASSEMNSTEPTWNEYQRPRNHGRPLSGSRYRVRYEVKPCGPLSNSTSWLPGHGIQARFAADDWLLLPKSCHTAGWVAGFRSA